MAKRSKKRESTRKINVPMTIAIVLFYLTLVSIYLTSGLYAKYTTKSSGQDGARVISFGGLTLEEKCGFIKNEEVVEGNLVIIPGVDLVKDVRVSFDGSEADTYIFVEAEMKGWVKSETNYVVKSEAEKPEDKKVQMSLSINTEDWTYLITKDETHIFYRLVESNEQMEKVPFIAGDGLIDVSETITKTEIKNLTGIEMNITAYAAQASGFESALEAWNSISKK